MAPAGTYLIEVVNPDYRYEPMRVDITAKGKVRARMVNNLQPSQVTLVRKLNMIIGLPYKIKMAYCLIIHHVVRVINCLFMLIFRSRIPYDLKQKRK